MPFPPHVEANLRRRGFTPEGKYAGKEYPFRTITPEGKTRRYGGADYGVQAVEHLSLPV